MQPKNEWNKEEKKSSNLGWRNQGQNQNQQQQQTTSTKPLSTKPDP